MSQEHLLKMSDEMLQAAISKAEQYKFAEKYTVDWGPRPRGQGRRFGKMVRGAMCGALYGVQEYIDPFYLVEEIPGFGYQWSGGVSQSRRPWCSEEDWPQKHRRYS